MEYQKLYLMIQKLLGKTREGLVIWKKTESDEMYQTFFSKYGVRVAEENSNHPTPDYYVYITDGRGEILEFVSDVDLSGWGEDSFKMMKELYHRARRQAKGVDDAIDDILHELDIPF